MGKWTNGDLGASLQLLLCPLLQASVGLWDEFIGVGRAGWREIHVLSLPISFFHTFSRTLK